MQETLNAKNHKINNAVWYLNDIYWKQDIFELFQLNVYYYYQQYNKSNL